MILVVDAGNTRTKWGVFDANGSLLAQGALDNARLHDLAVAPAEWAGCRQAIVANVAGHAVEQKLHHLLAALHLPVSDAIVRPAACGVTNGYAHPGQLGADRWAALVAAWNRYREPCVVASAGTALTVDVLSAEGVFLGGLIVPGMRLMREALMSGTAGLNADVGQWCEYPATTADAMHSGALNAMAGAVERMCARLEERESRPVRCLLTGGDAALLATALHRPVEIADNLVLYGLMLIEKELSGVV